MLGILVDALPRSLRHGLWLLPARRMQALTALALLLWAALECFGPLNSQSLAPATIDWMQRHRLWASPPDDRLLLIDIDERSLAEMAPEFGRWPWSRDTLATLLAHAEAQGAAMVVFDILFSDADRLRPGGDHALDAAVARNSRSFFPALRLPAAGDRGSELRVDAVPGLALPTPTAQRPPPTVAVVLPFMTAMLDSGRLGTQNAQLDDDGIVRRHAWAESLHGWLLPSLPWAVAHALGSPLPPDEALRQVVWRDVPNSYARVPFSLAWACADGARREGCPALAGKILVVGATAPSLHDLRSTPLAVDHSGLDILATLIDNALHQRAYAELSGGQRFALTALALLLAAWATGRAGVAGTSRALVGLPLLLLALGYASLHTERWLLDLTLPAAAALLYLSTLRLYDAARRRLLALPGPPVDGHAMWLRVGRRGGEHIERRVLDAVAELGGAAASGWQDCCAGAGLPSVWVVWGLADDAHAASVQRRLASSVPGAEFGRFAVQATPDGGLCHALAGTKDKR